jgi:hypothetical protein
MTSKRVPSCVFWWPDLRHDTIDEKIIIDTTCDVPGMDHQYGRETIRVA